MYALNNTNYPTLEQIDSFGLTPVQFRVYLHLWRLAQEGVISTSAESISKACTIARITVTRALSHLSGMGLINCDRTLGKKSVFYLMPFSNWRLLENKSKSKITSIKSDTCNFKIPVSELNTSTQQESTGTPPKGGSVDSAATAPVSQSDQFSSDTGAVEEATEEAEISLDDKIDEAQRRGWWNTGVWRDDLGRARVTVNSFVVSLEEFMEKSLDSFDVGRQVCETGLAMCREQIEKIKSKLARSIDNQSQ